MTFLLWNWGQGSLGPSDQVMSISSVLALPSIPLPNLTRGGPDPPSNSTFIKPYSKPCQMLDIASLLPPNENLRLAFLGD